MKVKVLKDCRWTFNKLPINMKIGSIIDVDAKHCADFIKYGFGQEVVESVTAVVEAKAVKAETMENKAITSDAIENKADIATDEPVNVAIDEEVVIRRGRKGKK